MCRTCQNCRTWCYGGLPSGNEVKSAVCTASMIANFYPLGYGLVGEKRSSRRTSISEFYSAGQSVRDFVTRQPITWRIFTDTATNTQMHTELTTKRQADT